MRRGASILLLGCFAATAIAQGAGCSSDDSTTPPPTTTSDAGKSDATTTVDAGPSACSGELPPLTVLNGSGEQVPADLSCYETDASFLAPIQVALLDDGGDAATDAADADIDAADADTDAADAAGPDSGGDAEADAGADSGGDAGPATTTVQVLEFVTKQATDGISVKVFYGKSVAGTPKYTGTTAGGGLLTFPSPPSDVKTLSFNASGTGYTPVNLYDTPILAPPAKTIDYTISNGDTAILVSAVLGSEPLSPAKTILVSAARDCQARDMRGGILELVDDATGQVVTSDKSTGGARVVYFNDTGLPSTTCTYTTNVSQAVWSVLNAPVNMDATGTSTHSYSVRMRGRRTAADAQPVLLNQVPIELWGGAGNVVRPYKQTPPQ